MSEGWSTVDERRYIARLGRMGLEKYLSTAALRQDWMGLDREEVLDYARGRLAKILKAEGRLVA